VPIPVDRYAACFPQISATIETSPSTVHNDEPMATYGYSFMLRAVEKWKAHDCSRAGARDELDSYLKAPLEATRDVIGWWGVSILFLLWIVVLTHHRNIWHSTQSLHRWLKIIYQFRAQQHLPNVHSQMHPSLIASNATS